MLDKNESGLLIARDGDRRRTKEDNVVSQPAAAKTAQVSPHSWTHHSVVAVLWLVHFSMLWSGAMLLCLLIWFVMVRIKVYGVSYSEDTS